jgi:hypothetical protein
MMNATVDDPDERDTRRRQLAKRLVLHRVRTSIIYRFTGYTRHRLATLRKRMRLPPRVRRRGPSPSSFEAFFHSPEARAEANGIAVLCARYGVVPAVDGQAVPDSFADLEWGERLCDPLDAFQASCPESAIEFELLYLLVVGLSKRDTIRIEGCKSCPARILVDLLSTRQRVCAVCQRRDAQRRSGDAEELTLPPPDDGGQQSLF